MFLFLNSDFDERFSKKKKKERKIQLKQDTCFVLFCLFVVLFVAKRLLLLAQTKLRVREHVLVGIVAVPVNFLKFIFFKKNKKTGMVLEIKTNLNYL